LGCGWLGLPLAKDLVSKGHVIKGSTTSESKISNLQSNGIEPFLIDLGSIQSTAEISKFLASEHLIIAIPPRVKHHNNFKEQIESLISFIESSTIKKVIFISSTSVYPNTNSLVMEVARSTLYIKTTAFKLYLISLRRSYGMKYIIVVQTNIQQGKNSIPKLH
jgi:nucleoside-diphosphate-sugar epimerase